MYKIPAKTHFLGKSIVFVPECHSTNALATEMTQKREVEEGTVFITNNQTKGRGQHGNLWISEPGKNLTLSLVIKPDFLAIRDQFYLTMITSLAIKDYLTMALGLAVSVKWPNDIIIHHKKICGILIENQIQGSILTLTVVGVGLNVNQNAFSYPMATSMKMISGNSFELQSVFEELCVYFEKWYDRLKSGRKEEIKTNYLNHLYGIRKRLNFKDHKGEFTGFIEGIDEGGRLIIRNGVEVRHYGVKEVQWEFDE